jgi:hypothetical protein
MLNYLITCGTSVDIPDKLFTVTSTIILLIEIAIPVLLIIFGMLDLGKAIIAQKEDEIKKGQQTFLKRVIAAVIVFLVVVVVKLLVSFIASDNADSSKITTCLECFVNGPKSDKCTNPKTTTSSEGTGSGSQGENPMEKK